VPLRTDEVHRVHDHADVRRVLTGIPALRDVDELDRRFVEFPLVLAVAGPVRVGLLEDDPALFDQPLEHEVDVELLVLCITGAERDVLEVDEEREALLDRRPARKNRNRAVGNGSGNGGRPTGGCGRGRGDRCRRHGRRSDRDRSRERRLAVTPRLVLRTCLAAADASAPASGFFFAVRRLGGWKRNGFVVQRLPPGR
jgi:hypothetical protein